ncbi:MAG: leucine-rich repeat domain-containing protein [Kiritimatiellae bacterium]|jgi:hypothetical protein|nr:leucine-rich repeat domain-containing protein [Kiritimatiellia bacterium]
MNRNDGKYLFKIALDCFLCYAKKYRLLNLVLKYFIYCVFLISPFMVHAFTEGDYTYIVSNGEATIVSLNEYYYGSLIIPESLGGYPVTCIGRYAFNVDGNCNITDITIPETITVIEEFAFHGCSGLTNLTIPNSVTNIGNSVFLWCDKLAEISVAPDNLFFSSLNGVLYDYDKSTLYFVPKTIEGSFTIPDSVIYIDNSALRSCVQLTSVIIGPNLLSTVWFETDGEYYSEIDGDTFQGCDSLSEIIVSENNERYSSFDGVLFNKDKSCLIRFPQAKADNAIIPDGVEYFGSYSFESCFQIHELNLPDSVTRIGWGAFGNCTNLTTVMLGSDIHEYQNFHYVFSGCTMLNEIDVSPDNLQLSSQEGVLFNKDGTDLIYYPQGKQDSYVIPQGVISIHDSAFNWLTTLTTIAMPDSLTSIGNSAFNSCRNLSNVTMGASVSNIGNSAFAYCDNLSAITIPESVNVIGNGAFQSCNSLREINVDENNHSFIDLDGVLFNYDQTELIQYPAGRLATEYSIPQGVTSIVDRAFADCDYLNTLSSPNSIVYIGNYAFYGCYYLSSVLFEGSPPELGDYTFMNCGAIIYYIEGSAGWANTFGGRPTAVYPYTFTIDNGQITIQTFNDPESGIPIPSEISGYPVTAIADAAFYGCTNLVRVSIPDSVISIGFAAFAGCSSLEIVTLGTSVSEIGNWAFFDCPNLTSVYAKGNAPDYGSSVFCGSPATIYYMPDHTGWGDTFADCPVVYLPYTYTILNGEVKIDSYSGDFATVEIPSYIEGYPVTEIGPSAFEDCNTLISITIPDSVNIIGEAAFCNCQMLSDITFKTSPSWQRNYISIGDWAFAGCDSLTVLIIPYINSIGDFAFAFCSSLTEIYFSSYNPPSVGEEPFAYTPVTVFTTDGDWGDTFAGVPVQQTLYSYYFYDDSVVITDYRGNNIHVSVPSTIIDKPVIAITYQAFLRNEIITDITIPSSVIYIGENVFDSCTALTNVTLSVNLEEIGSAAFVNCSKLISIDIPASTTNIGNFAFGLCSSLTNICIDAANPRYSSFAGVLFDKIQSNLIQYPEGKEGPFTIPPTVNTISDWAFYNCSGLTSVFIGSSVSSIGDNAFGNCHSLVQIDVSAENIFYSSLDGVLFNKDQTILITFPSEITGVYSVPLGVTNIDDYAFASCCNLTNVTFSSTVNSIGEFSFAGCNGLTSISIPDSVSFIGDCAFNYCTNLIEVIFPSNLSSIGNGTFGQCYNLASILIPSEVTSIGADAFYCCNSLTSITIPSSVVSIGDWAFCECTKLSSVLCQGTPPELVDYSGEAASWPVLFENTPATVYYLPDSSGWGENFVGCPTLCWNPAILQNQSFGFKSGQFGFNVTGNANIPIKIEATDNLKSENWTSLINTSMDETGSLDFIDHESLNKTKQFYRIIFP